MFCRNCGKQVQVHDKFCPACGTRIQQESQSLQTQNTCNDYQTNESPQPKPVKTKSKKILWISVITGICVIAAVVTLLILCGVFDFDDSSQTGSNPQPDNTFHSQSAEQPQAIDNSAEKYRNSYNMTDNMYVARNDKYIFYIGSGDNVIRMDANFENRKSMLEGKGIDIIYMSGETLYFHSKNDFHIYRSDLNGENVQQVSTVQNLWFAIVGTALYFQEGYSVWDEETFTTTYQGNFALYRSDLDGGNCEKLIDQGVSKVSIQDDGIVYYDMADKVICVTGLDAADHQVLNVDVTRVSVQGLRVYKNKLYYDYTRTGEADDSGIYCLDLETGISEKIISTISGDFTFYKDSIIYAADTNSSNSSMHICDLDGRNDKILSESLFYQPLVMGDSLYFRAHGLSSQISVYNLNTHLTEDFESIRYSDIAFTDNYIFYIDSNDKNIYRCDYDGKNAVKLTDSKCYCLYTYRNRLYYDGYANGYSTDNPKTPSGIYADGFFQLDENGQYCKAVELNASSNIIFYDDYIYFRSSYTPHIYRSSLDTIDNPEDNQPFIMNSGEGIYNTLHFIENNWIYFSYWKNNNSRSATIARMRLDGSDIEIIIDNPVYGLTLYNNKIYYRTTDDDDNWQLRSTNLDGSNDTLIMKSDISTYHIADDVIYYIHDTNQSIYRVNLDGTNRTRLNDTACNMLKLNGDRLYYGDLYNRGYIYSMKLDGSDQKVLITKNDNYTQKTGYTTKGIDDAVIVTNEKNKDISYRATDIMTFKDPEFEAFLCEMFQKEAGTITGADLLSVKFFGYYEGAPETVSTLENLGKYYRLYENSVLFSTETYPANVRSTDVLCGDNDAVGKTYREGCTLITVRSNEWIAEHVMPYLYYFKNAKEIVFGYCWIGDNPCMPIGVDWNAINPHDRYYHPPYDPLYN